MKPYDNDVIVEIKNSGTKIEIARNFYFYFYRYWLRLLVQNMDRHLEGYGEKAFKKRGNNESFPNLMCGKTLLFTPIYHTS